MINISCGTISIEVNSILLLFMLEKFTFLINFVDKEFHFIYNKK